MIPKGTGVDYDFFLNHEDNGEKLKVSIIAHHVIIKIIVQIVFIFSFYQAHSPA
jgi:hypothetical protein